MKVLIIIGVILSFFLLLSLVRVGGMVDYSADGFVVKLRLGAFRFTFFPWKLRKKKPKKGNKKTSEESPKLPNQPAAQPGGSLEVLRAFLPLVSEAAGRFKRKVRIDQLDLDLTVACPDPALTAMAYGSANGMAGMMLAILEHNFNVKERRVRIAVDFERDRPAVALRAALTLTIGQGAAMTLTLGLKALRILLSHQKQLQTKQKEAV